MSLLFPPPGITVYRVGELARAVKTLLEEAHPSVWVEGEVSNLARPQSGHLYLTLKDEEAPLRAVVYRGVALRMKFDLRDGLKVIVRGKLTMYTQRGDVQLQVEEVQPKGVGPLELAYRQLKEKLSVRGYFEPRRKRPLPRFPRRVALVTSPTGSAVRDLLEVLSRRWPLCEVWICPVRVQGEGAAQEIAAALGILNRLGVRADNPAPRLLDVIILGRGGGSLEDLWAFNEEPVAQAIYESRIPIVTGVGHEDDLTIADLVADCRALTPSEAAERVVPDQAELLAGLEQLQDRLKALLRHQLETANRRLEDLASRRCFQQPLDRLREAERLVDEYAERLARAARQRVESARQVLDGHTARLDSLSPLNVLARGYTLTRKEEEREVLRRAADVRPGDVLITRLHSGVVRSRVEEVTP
jgi:exodeoxyribonuclease VII large subunit